MDNYDCQNRHCMKCHPLRTDSILEKPRDSIMKKARYSQDAMKPGSYSSMYTPKDIAEIEARALRAAADMVDNVWAGVWEPDAIASELRDLADAKEGK